jgi:hypothetical protein
MRQGGFRKGAALRDIRLVSIDEESSPAEARLAQLLFTPSPEPISTKMPPRMPKAAVMKRIKPSSSN